LSYNARTTEVARLREDGRLVGNSRPITFDRLRPSWAFLGSNLPEPDFLGETILRR